MIMSQNTTVSEVVVREVGVRCGGRITLWIVCMWGIDDSTGSEVWCMVCGVITCV